MEFTSCRGPRESASRYASWHAGGTGLDSTRSLRRGKVLRKHLAGGDVGHQDLPVAEGGFVTDSRSIRILRLLGALARGMGRANRVTRPGGVATPHGVNEFPGINIVPAFGVVVGAALADFELHVLEELERRKRVVPRLVFVAANQIRSGLRGGRCARLRRPGGFALARVA